MKNTLLLSLSLILAGATSAWAEDAPASKGKPAMEMTKEARETMAASHEKMAACLRSDQSMESCRDEMMKACQSNMDKGMCPMMGGMHGHGGRGGKHKGPPPSSSKE